LQPDGTRPGPPISPYIPRHALHAAELSFSHPISGEWQTFHAALPEDMAHAVELCQHSGEPGASTTGV
jgi:23S rRNA pseudouridine1911/1915/1917 synthase